MSTESKKFPANCHNCKHVVEIFNRTGLGDLESFLFCTRLPPQLAGNGSSEFPQIANARITCGMYEMRPRDEHIRRFP